MVIEVDKNKEIELKCGSMSRIGLSTLFSSFFITGRLIHLDYYSNYSFDNYDHWDEIRKKGKKNFIFKYGILRWGMSTGILAYVLAFFNISHHTNSIISYIISLLGSLISFSIVGCFFGIIMWEFLRRKDL